MVKEYIIGIMVVFMKEIGLIIICKEKEFILGQMEKNILVIMKMIKKMDMEFIFIVMVENMKENGLMVKCMELEI